MKSKEPAQGSANRLHHFNIIFQGEGDVTTALKITHHDRNIYLLESLCVMAVVQGNKHCFFA